MRIDIVTGDITKREVDAIVNAANSSLLGGGGVDGAIHAAAGPELLAACRRVRASTWPDGLPTGRAVATPGYDLPAHWVIHTVGPNARAGETDPELLAWCFRSSLKVADEIGATSLAFPAVSAGIYGWEPEKVAEVALQTVMAHESGSVERVEFVLFSDHIARIFRSVYRDLSALRGKGSAG